MKIAMGAPSYDCALLPAAALRSVPARERIDGLLRGSLERENRLVFTVLDLLDEHLVVVLIRVAGVVGELDGAHDAVPLAGLEELARLLRIRLPARGRLGHHHHCGVGAGG